MSASQQAFSPPQDAPSFDQLKGALLDANATETATGLANCSDGLDDATPLATWRVRFARLGRVAPRTPLARTAALAPYAGLTLPRYCHEDVIARMAFLLLLDACVPVDQGLLALTTLYRTGSSREQASIMRTLPWLPDAQRFRPLASEAARTNDLEVFAALAIANPFPVGQMDDDAFFQLVIKSMFLEQDTIEILGLRSRITPELRRMTADYKQERIAAARSLPAGVGFILDALD